MRGLRAALAVACALACAAAVPAADSSQYNLIRNGGFEEVTFNYGALYWQPFVIDFAFVSTDMGHTGQASLVRARAAGRAAALTRCRARSNCNCRTTPPGTTRTGGGLASTCT